MARRFWGESKSNFRRRDRLRGPSQANGGGNELFSGGRRSWNCFSFFGNRFADDGSDEVKVSASASIDQAKAYCTYTGGELELRHAVFGTNNPQQDWLWLTGVQSFCQYTLSSDGSRIHLSLPTLFSPKPTLAALAYYSQVPWNGQGNGNPASFYCTQLGGAEIGATDFSGGGWVLLGSIDESLEACVFPDNSTIDSWGLFYHSASIVRGIDLAMVLKYPNPYAAKR